MSARNAPATQDWQQPPDLAVVICTFHRNELLANCLASLSAQAGAASLHVEVIVIDNSDAGSARDVVTTAAQTSPFDLRWIAAHPANISVARNAGVRATDAAFIAFLDDDQTTEPGWLEAMAQALRTLPHDAWFGAIDPVFETPERATPAIRQLFSRRLDAPSGHELIAMGPDKTRGVALATSNSLFRCSAMLLSPEPFDPAFGNGGGEDYDLICRMQRAGSRFGWLPDARAKEIVPATRCEPAYLRQRFFAGGQAFAAAVAKASATPGSTRWIIRLKAVVQACLLAVQMPFYAMRGRAAWNDYTYAVAGVLGKLSFTDILPIYRAPTGR